jgi:uncharacterized protein (DUF952 family)
MTERIDPRETGEELHDTREQVIYHLRTALEATETAEKQFHVREALQLLTIEEP